MSKEQKELVNIVRELMRNEVYPTILEKDRAGGDPFDWSYVELLAQHNLIVPVIPEEYGGRGLDYVSSALIIEEIAAACAGLAACMVGTIHALLPVIIAGSGSQKRNWLPLFTKKKPILASFALTEPKGGSDIEKLETTAELKEGFYYINGIKDFVINGAVADYVLACTCGEEKRRATYRFFMVPRDQVRISKVIKTMGIKYANTSQILLENATVSEEHLIGDPRTTYLLLNQILDLGRPLIGAIQIGIARAALEMVLRYSQEREQFGRPIISNQGVSFPLARMATNIDAARLMVWKACALIDQEGDYTKASSMARLFTSRVGQAVTAAAIDLMGGQGYTDENPLNMYFRDAKVCSIVGGTDNVQQMIIASLL